MYIALDLQKNRVSIENHRDDEKYYCPICRGEVIPKAVDSKIVSTHFAHKHKCTDTWNYEPMSEWHLNWQKQFPEEYQEVVITNNEEIHRADICTNGYVIEIQHSQITEEEFNKRNNFYIQQGYKVIWILDGTSETATYPFYKKENRYYWKRKKKAFPDVIPVGVYFFIQIDSGELAWIDHIEDHKTIVLLNNFPFISSENLFKEVGLLSDSNVKSLGDLFLQNQEIQINNTFWRMHTIFRPQPQFHRHFHF